MDYSEILDCGGSCHVYFTLLNTHLRDQLKYVGGADSRGTSLPGSPDDGQLYVYVADAANAIEWLLKYNSGDAGSYKWHKIGGPPLIAEVTTAQALSAGVSTYTALATTGPTVTVPLAGDYLVTVGALSKNDPNGGAARDTFMSYDIGGTGAVDADALKTNGGSATFGSSGTRTRLKTGIAASTALTAKYRTGGGTCIGTWENRFLLVDPVRVG